jgi:hypothetical protein
MAHIDASSLPPDTGTSGAMDSGADVDSTMASETSTEGAAADAPTERSMSHD